MKNDKDNNLIVADSTPLGTHGKVLDANHYCIDIELARQAEQARLERSSIINTNADERHYKEMVKIEAEREYGNEKSSRRFETTPEYHTIAEMRELLNYGVFPTYNYTSHGLNNIQVIDYGDFDMVEAGRYYYNVQGKLRTTDVTLTNMIIAYTTALRTIINQYPKQPGKGSIRDLLMREFVDQVHRKSRVDVECGTQVNFIEDYELVTEVSGCESAMSLLNKCYARIEDIDSGLSSYEQYDEELYFPPSSYPVLNESKRDKFLEEYRNLAFSEFTEYFKEFDVNATTSFYYMMNVLIQMKFELAKINTLFGQSIEGYYIDSQLITAVDHIKATVDFKNSMRKKLQLLSALSYCIELAWSKEPKCQTTT